MKLSLDTLTLLSFLQELHARSIVLTITMTSFVDAGETGERQDSL